MADVDWVVEWVEEVEEVEEGEEGEEGEEEQDYASVECTRKHWRHWAPGVSCSRAPQGDWVGDRGKFRAIDFAGREHPNGYFLSVDDDILYPPDYAQKSVAAIDR
jgi:hypothetical protein